MPGFLVFDILVKIRISYFKEILTKKYDLNKNQDNLNIIHKPTLKAVGQTVLAYLQNVELE